jgi:hypothetical protein
MQIENFKARITAAQENYETAFANHVGFNTPK